MGEYDGRHLYRDWLSVRADNGPLLYVSSPTGNGEMVCAMEYQYYFNCTSFPTFNNPYYSWYDGQTGYAWWECYSTPLDGATMFEGSSLLSVKMDLGYPHNGWIPVGDTAPAGIFRKTTLKYTHPSDPDYDDEWKIISRPFMTQGEVPWAEEDGTGKKLFVFEPRIHQYLFIYPSENDIADGDSYPTNPDTGLSMTFDQVADVIRDWDYNDWANADHGRYSYGIWAHYIGDDYKDCVGWNYRKKGYGTMVQFTPATSAWIRTNLHTHPDTINERLLQNQGSYEMFIVKPS